MKKGYNVEDLPSLENPLILEPEDHPFIIWKHYCAMFLGNDVDARYVARIVISKERGLEYFINDEIDEDLTTEFESIEEILDEEGHEHVSIIIEDAGIYVYTDKDDLRRELDLQNPTTIKQSKAVIIDKLLNILMNYNGGTEV